LTNDSFQTVEPPSLRHAGCDVSTDVEGEEFPGARAVYPNNPLRNAGFINNLTISKTPDDIGDGNNNNSRSCSLSLLRSDEPSTFRNANNPNIDSTIINDSESKLITSVKVEPVVMARLVRESEILDHEKDQSLDPTRPCDIAEAIEVKDDNEEVTRRTLISAMKDWRFILGLLILLAVTVGATAGIVKLTERKNDTSGDTPDVEPKNNQTIFLTPEQIANNEAIVKALLTRLPLSSVNAISTPGSPHRSAVEWLIDNNNLDELPLFRTNQRYALAVLYFSTGGVNSWTNKTHWLSSLHECEWFQSITYNGRENVPCSDGTSVIKTLVLAENLLYGSIPIDVALLSNLETFAFPSNFLQHKIPVESTIMVNLVTLDLGSNNFQGPLPPLTNHSNLATIDFSSNNLEGQLPESYSNLNSLERLDLSQNPGINGTIPESLSRLTNLRQLSIDGTALTGSVPASFCQDGRMINITIDCDQIRCDCCGC